MSVWLQTDSVFDKSQALVNTLPSAHPSPTSIPPPQPNKHDFNKRLLEVVRKAATCTLHDSTSLDTVRACLGLYMLRSAMMLDMNESMFVSVDAFILLKYV